MKKQTTKNTIPDYFLITEKYKIGTPKSIPASDKTIDILFYNLAKDFDLQTKLRLSTKILVTPPGNQPLKYHLKGKNLIESVAVYLSSFQNNPHEYKQRKEYLSNNGLVRILLDDDNLRKELISKKQYHKS